MTQGTAYGQMWPNKTNKHTCKQTAQTTKQN